MNFMRMMVSYGNSYGSIGGKSSGGGGVLDSSMGFLSTLPPWLSTIIMVIGVVIVALIIGWIFGKIIGGILYPDPDKESVFNVKQRLGIFLAIIITIGGTGYVIYNELNPKPIEDDMMVNGGMSDGVVPEGDVANGIMPEGDTATPEALPEDNELDVSDDIVSNDVNATTEDTSSSQETPVAETPVAETPVVETPVVNLPVASPKI